MKRIVQAELLDTLESGDPRAIRSRRDLRRVNTWMRNHAIMARTLAGSANGHAPQEIMELGAGDGDFLLGVARRLAASWQRVHVTLLDRQPASSPRTLAGFADLGWRAEPLVTDVFEWARASSSPLSKVIVANLFLHHFTEAPLAELFRTLAGSAQLFVAVEPRRGLWPLFCSRLLWGLGCNLVTQYDAMVSVRAGFSGCELSALWPRGNGWRLKERAAGPFSHLFVARRAG